MRQETGLNDATHVFWRHVYPLLANSSRLINKIRIVLLISRRLRIGAHTSIAKSLEDAALTAARIGANTFQIFSASPRMWRASPPAPSEVKLLTRAREKHDLYPLVIHDN